MIYGNKFMNYGITSFDGSLLIESDIENINTLLESLDIVNEAVSFKEIISKIFGKIKSVIKNIINFISQILIGLLEKMIKFIEKIVSSLKSKKELNDKEADDLKKSLHDLSNKSSIKENVLYEWDGPNDDYETESDFVYYIRWLSTDYWCDVRDFIEDKTHDDIFLCYLSSQYRYKGDKDQRQEADESFEELQKMYDEYENRIKDVFGKFVNNWTPDYKYNQKDKVIFNSESLPLDKKGTSSKWFASDIINNLQDQNKRYNEQIKQLKMIKNEISDLDRNIEDASKVRLTMEKLDDKDIASRLEKCITILSKYCNLTLKTTNNILDNYVACLRTNGQSLVKFFKYGYRNLDED